MERLKIVISAYACRPHMGSEPGVGWNMVQEISKHHDLWVLTRADNRPVIEAELAGQPMPGVHFIYCDLPAVSLWKRGLPLVHLHYYLWQWTAYWTARSLHSQVNFDLAHHLTYVRHSSPSLLSLLPIPFIWGPVGGGESAPKAFWQDFGRRGTVYETLRELLRWVGEQDPFVKLTARRSAIANATTADTAAALKQLGATRVQIVSQVGLSEAELINLSRFNLNTDQPLRFVSIGRLLHWKGFHLGLRAFARANLPVNAEYWLIGEGAEQSRLQQLADRLGIRQRVRFLGNLPREAVQEKLEKCSVLVHPSLHESGGFVCLEAMAAGRPVLCLDLGGPAIQVIAETGFKVAAKSPEQVVQSLAAAMEKVAANPALLKDMAIRSRQRVRTAFSWKAKGDLISELYETLYQPHQKNVHPPNVRKAEAEV